MVCLSAEEQGKSGVSGPFSRIKCAVKLNDRWIKYGGSISRAMMDSLFKVCAAKIKN